jgi:hypothetical protein
MCKSSHRARAYRFLVEAEDDRDGGHLTLLSNLMKAPYVGNFSIVREKSWWIVFVSLFVR